MSEKSSFLSVNPKIIKKVPGNKNAQLYTSRSNFSKSVFDSQYLSDSSSVGNNEDEIIVSQILFKQSQIQLRLENQIQKLKMKNEVLNQSLKHYDTYKQQKSLLQQIEHAKREQINILEKINNCEKIQKSTTSQEYYLWQKKKKSDEFQRKVEEVQIQYDQQTEHYKNICINYGKAIDQTKYRIKETAEAIAKLEMGGGSTEKNEAEQLNENQLKKIQREYQQLKATVQLMREDNSILNAQFKDTAQSTQNFLNKAFESNKSSLVKDLLVIKAQIEQRGAEPPQVQDKQIRVSIQIQQYQNKCVQIKQSVDQEIAQQIPNLLKAYNWRSVDWEHYLGERNQQSNQHYNQYQTYLKEIQQTDQGIKYCDNQLRVVINQTVQLQQKNNQVEQAMSKAYRSSTTYR